MVAAPGFSSFGKDKRQDPQFQKEYLWLSDEHNQGREAREPAADGRRDPYRDPYYGAQALCAYHPRLSRWLLHRPCPFLAEKLSSVERIFRTGPTLGRVVMSGCHSSSSWLERDQTSRRLGISLREKELDRR